MSGTLLDLKLAARSLRRRTVFTAAAVATLALGIGATVAVFGVAHAVLLRPLPFPQPDRLVRVFQAYPERDVRFGEVSRSDLDDWAARSRHLSGLAAYSRLPGSPTRTGGERPDLLDATWTSGEFFTTLGVEAARGRTFGPREETAGERVAVLSWEAWQHRFGGDPGVVGGTVELDGEPWMVTGVLPEGVAFPTGTEVWLPLGAIPESSIPRLRVVRYLDALGRLAPGTGLEQAEQELSAVAAALSAEYPDSNAAAGAATVVPLIEHIVGGVRPALLALFAAVALMLLVACTNAAGLWLVRGLDRRRETALRAALGAGRLRLMREMLAESLLVTVAGGALGLLVALWGGELLVRMAGELLPRPAEVAPDAAVLAFTIAVTLGSSLLVGLLPAWRTTAREARLHLGSSQRAGLDRRPARLLPGLVVCELLLATLLLIGAGLLVRSLGSLLAAPAGFDPKGVVAISLGLPEERYPERPDYLAAYRRLLERLAAVPGVESVASLRNLPLSGDPAETYHWSASEPPPQTAPTARLHMVSPGLFRTLRVPLLDGRDLTAAEVAGAPPVVVINRTLAERAFPGRRAVGRRLWLTDQPSEVVGVVGDVRHDSLAEPADPAVYVAQEQVPRRAFTLLLRGRDGTPPQLSAVQAAVWAEDPDLATQQVALLSDVTADSAERPRFFTMTLVVLAALAAVLAAVGVYGVMSYVTGLRRHEIGVRLTLGARRGEILRLLLGRGMALAAAGVALGAAAALPAARLLRSQLYGIGPSDPWAFGGAVAVLLAAAGWAVFVPARRGARLDPRQALDRG
jgi:predicted permease